MKLKLTDPPRLSAIDKKTGQVCNVIQYRCGRLDKNQDGVELTLDKLHNGKPIPRRWDEVEVMIDVPMEIRWEEEMFTLKGYAGNHRLFKIWLAEIDDNNAYEIETTLPHCLCNQQFTHLEKAKEYCQRLFDEWMGGLFL